MAPAPDGPAMRPHAPSCSARKCDVENGGAWAPTPGPSGQPFPDRDLVAGRADPVTGLRPAGGAGSVGLPYSSYSSYSSRKCGVKTEEYGARHRQASHAPHVPHAPHENRGTENRG